MFVLETQPLPRGDSQWFSGHSPLGGARPRLASPDGLRQGLALGGLGSSQGGLSPGLRAGPMTRAKLKGTWRGPEEVWGWAGHGAEAGIRQVARRDLRPRVLSPGRHQDGFHPALRLAQAEAHHRTMAKSSGVCPQPDSSPTSSEPGLFHPCHRQGTAQKRLLQLDSSRVGG